MAATLCPPLPAAADAAPANSGVPIAFLDLVAQLLQFTEVEPQTVKAATPAPSGETDVAPTKEEEPQKEKREPKDETATVPVWSTIPVERTVLPWTFNFPTAQAQPPAAEAPVKDAQLQDAQLNDAPAPVLRTVDQPQDPHATKTPASPIAFIAEIETAPAPQPTPHVVAEYPERAVSQPATPVMAALAPVSRVQSAERAEAASATPAPSEPVAPAPTPEPETPVLERPVEKREVERPDTPPKIETGYRSDPLPDQRKTSAVQPSRDETPERGQDKPDSKAPAPAPSPAPAKKAEKNTLTPDAAAAPAPELRPLNAASGVPVRDKGAPAQTAAPSEPTVAAPTARVQATEKPASAARPEPVRDIAMRVTADTAKPVDIRLSERSGKVEVTVRTPDPELRTALQSDIGHLVGRLESDGLHTKVWTPADSAAVLRLGQSAAASNDQAQDAPNHRGSQNESGGQRRQQQREPETGWFEEFESKRNGGRNK